MYSPKYRKQHKCFKCFCLSQFIKFIYKKPFSISRNYPFKENYTHILGYVSQASPEDIKNNEAIKNSHVPGLKVGKNGLDGLKLIQLIHAKQLNKSNFFN